MRVWLFKDGETLPVEKDSRRMRTGMLAEELRRQGHEVHWFHSTFLHGKKQLFVERDEQHAIAPGFTVHLIHAGGFQRNVSIRRYLFHRRYAARLAAYCRTLPPPDVIVCAFPLIDVAAWAVEYGRTAGIPVIVDVRDLWPDTILDVFPRAVRPLARVALSSDFTRTAAVMRQADALTAMSNGVLAWGLAYAGRPRTAEDRVFPIGFPVAPRPAPLPPTPRLAPWLPALAGKRLFTYVGTFGVTYDVRGMVAAARLLHARGGTDAHLVIAGSGAILEEIRGMARDLPNVTVPGWLDNPDVRALMSQSWAGMLPWAGLDDAMPNKFFEYISAGLPVLSSARGELNDLIEREGIGAAYAAGDPAGIAAVVADLASDPARRARMAAVSFNLFDTRFREDIVYRDFAAYVTDLVARRRAA